MLLSNQLGLALNLEAGLADPPFRLGRTISIMLYSDICKELFGILQQVRQAAVRQT